MKSIKGKTIVITGAGRGVGRAIVNLFLKEGAKVAAMSKSRNNLESLQTEHKDNSNLYCEVGDVSHEPTVKRFIDTTLENFSTVDCLINNAAILSDRAPIHQVNTSEWEAALHTNLTGPFLMTKAVLPTLLKKNKGLILNVVSGVAVRPAPEWGPYAVSKAGLESLTQLTAAELKGTGIRVNSVNPGGTRTEMRAKAFPSEDPMTLPPPEEIAKMFLWLVMDESKKLDGKWIEFSEWVRSRS